MRTCYGFSFNEYSSKCSDCQDRGECKRQTVRNRMDLDAKLHRALKFQGVPI